MKRTIYKVERKWEGRTQGPILLKRRQALKLIAAMPFAFRVGRSVARAGRGSVVTATPSGPGFYPSTNSVASPLGGMQLIYPQPDSVTNAYAAHHWAYFDGTVGFWSPTPIGVRLGRFPYVAMLTAAPTGMSFGAYYWQSGWTQAQAIAAGVWVLNWTPTADWTNEAVMGYFVDQDGYRMPFAFTVSTDNGTTTAHHVFADPVNGSDTNSGVRTLPLKTWTPLFGASQLTTTFPGAKAVLRAGTHAAIPQTSFGVVLDSAYSPMTVMSYPGESVVIDVTNSGSEGCFVDHTNGDSDFFLQGWSYTGATAAIATNYRYFTSNARINRFTAHKISAVNPQVGSAPTGNNTLFDFEDPANGSLRQYLHFREISESGRPNGSGQSYGIHDIFVGQYGLTELCSSMGSNATYNMALKATVFDWTRRCCTSVVASGGFYTYWDFAQNNGYGQTVGLGNIETCYCIGDSSLSSSSGGVPYAVNEDGQGQGVTTLYRNTFVGGALRMVISSTDGPYTYIDDVIQYGTQTGPVYTYVSGTGYENIAFPSNATNTGTECQASSSVVNSSTYLLTGSYTAYNGTRGHNIST